MIKTYSDFLAVIDCKCALYAEIPAGHLSVNGSSTYELYRAVEFLACFADSAAELLDIIVGDADVDKAAKYAESEYKQIIRCLRRLADAENAPTT